MSWLRTGVPLAALILAPSCSESPDECEGRNTFRARFKIDGGVVDNNGDFSEGPCTIVALAPSLDLDCAVHIDSMSGRTRFRITLTAQPAITVPAKIGDEVSLLVRGNTDWNRERGIWRVVRNGNLLIGGNFSDDFEPLGEGGFFRPVPGVRSRCGDSIDLDIGYRMQTDSIQEFDSEGDEIDYRFLIVALP